MNHLYNAHGKAVLNLLDIDPALEAVVRLAGPLPERPPIPGFAGLAGVVVSQFVSRASADAIWARLVASTGPDLTPEAYLRVGRGEGPRLGLTAAKADTLVGAAEEVLEGRLDLDGLAALDAEAAIARLRSVKGIGPWTAEVHLLFHCGHPDIFPAGDLALRSAFAAVFGQGEKPGIEALRRYAARWTPCRSTAARLLWAYYGQVLRKSGPTLPQLTSSRGKID